jgi:hypothetical protein
MFRVRQERHGLSSPRVFHLVIALFLSSVAFAAEQPAFNPPEFYDHMRDLRAKIIAEQTKKIDLSTHPRYRCAVTNNDSVLHVDRLPSWFQVNRSTGVVDRVGLLNVVCAKRCAFGDLEVTDAAGRVYRQSASKSSIDVVNENIYLYWNVRFSPVSDDGEKLPITIEARYQLFKLSGMVAVRYKVLDGQAQIKQLVVRNSPGELPVVLDIAHSAFFKGNDGGFNDTLSIEVPDTKPRILMSGKVVAPFWTNGQIGFSGVALRETWSQMEPLDVASEYKRTVVHSRDGNRAIDFYFVNTDSPVALEAGREAACAFALMPFQRYQPRLPLVDASVDLAVQFRYLKSGDERELIEDFRRCFWAGAIFSGTGLASSGWTPLMFAVTKQPDQDRIRRIVELGRQCELVLGTASCIVNSFPGIPGVGGREGDDANAVTPEFLAQIEKAGFTSLSDEAIRDMWLDVRTSTLEVFDVDADYEDLHAHIDVGKNFDSQVEGELRYLEGIALLHEHYGRDKIIIAHAGNILTPADGLNGATWAGEPWTGQNFRELPLAVLDSVINPFLLGVDTCMYGLNQIYDPESVPLVKQLLRNGAVPMYVTLANQLGGSVLRPFKPVSEEAVRVWERYFVPGRTFRTDRSRFVSWRDPSATDYFMTDNDDHKVNLYYREGEAYVTCVDLSEEPHQPTLSINVSELGFAGPEVFVFDVLANKLEVRSVQRGWVHYVPDQPTAEPVLAYLKDKQNDDPEVVWANFPIRFERTSLTDNGVVWKCDVPVYPLEHRREVARVYVGKRGRPRSYAPWGVAYVKEFYESEHSMDMIIEIPPAKEGGPIGGGCASGAGGVGGEVHMKWDKAFQLSFPYLDDDRVEKK